MLRDYQQDAIDQVYSWMGSNEGNPCLVLPTGAGKSHVVAALCKNIIQSYSGMRILMLTHVKELIEQNAEKMRQHWPGAPLGIYSASLNKRELREKITFAGIQSIQRKLDLLGVIDIVIVDECHLISHKDEGGYRQLIKTLHKKNKQLRVIGLTATPYRLGHGYIDEGENRIFNARIEPVTILDLIERGFLSTLRSKQTGHRISAEGTKKRGGDYIESELQKALDTDDNNVRVVDEVIARAEKRKSWLFFCTGVDHATHIAELLIERGIKAAVISGKTPKGERRRLITEFKSGQIKALTNANVLTTGFDHPDIDLIAFVRPTLSTALYMQMAGRGLRLKSHTDHCLVLDFVGLVDTHGPITDVNPPRKKGAKEGEAPVKLCEMCHEKVHLSCRVCPSCGTPFEISEAQKKILTVHNSDIMGLDKHIEHEVKSWNWSVHTSKSSKKDMIKIRYHLNCFSKKPIDEYLPLQNSNHSAAKAMLRLTEMATDICDRTEGVQSIDLESIQTLDALAMVFNALPPPSKLTTIKDGIFHKVVSTEW